MLAPNLLLNSKQRFEVYHMLLLVTCLTHSCNNLLSAQSSLLAICVGVENT